MQETIRNYSVGNRINTANGLNPKVKEYNKFEFVKGINEYLSSDDDKHKYIKERKNNKWCEYCTTIMSFDIEVTSTYIKGEKRVIPYIWQIAIQDYVFYGRHFSDIVEMFDVLSAIFETNEDRRIIVWVHNLPYEFQAIRKYFKWKDVFLLDERKPVRALTDKGIEFRCSYILSGMSLADLSEKGIHKNKVKKLVGDLDYSKVRHEKTPLTDNELQYAINDVLVCVEYITEQVNELYDGNITKLPMTKTGAVRQYVRSLTINHQDIHVAKRYSDLMSKLTLDTEEYKTLTRAFAGGFTHANPNYVGHTLEGVSSADISSSYPAVICTEKYPMSKGMLIKIDGDWEKYIKLAKSGLMVFDIAMRGVKSAVNYEHILQYAKCYSVRKCKVDNNRVVEAESLITTMTSVDLEVFLKFYDVENMYIADAWYYEADYLPRELVNAVLQLFSDKTTLKDVGQDLLYMLKKANLNSVYGMMVMAVLREVIEYVGDDYVTRLPELDSAIKEYNNSKTRFLYYPWGVFVTSYARKRLQEFILKIGDDHVYSDTDSDKFLNIEEHYVDVEEFNLEIDKKNEAVSKALNLELSLFYPKDINGVVHPLGYLEIETSKYGPYKRFKTLGAKRYLVEEVSKNGSKIKLTCAGVNKIKGAEYISDKEEPFEFFDTGMRIPEGKSGKTTATYIDTEYEFECTDYLGIKDMCVVKSGTHIEPTSFELSMEYSFKKFLASIENRKYITRR